MLELFGRATSINVRKVLWLADELGLELVHHGGDGTPLDRAELLALNPNALIPVIRDDGRVLWESNTICRYLAARENRGDLLPAEPMARARVEQWMDWQTTELNDAWRYAFMATVRRSPMHTDAAAVTASVQAWNHAMGILERQIRSAGGTYVLGTTFTVADIVLGLSVHRWFAAPIERPVLPAVSDYYASLSERPAFLRHGRNGMP